MPTAKHGNGSVMVWGCSKKTEQGILNEEGYKQIMENNVLMSGQQIVGREFVFQEDNDSNHSSKLYKEFISEKEKRRFLNYMLLRNELDRMVKKMSHSSSTSLGNPPRGVGPGVLDKLLRIIARLCQLVIKKKCGFSIKIFHYLI